MDSQDLKHALTEHKGCLVLSRQELSSEQVETAGDITKLFKQAIESSYMHKPVSYFGK